MTLRILLKPETSAPSTGNKGRDKIHVATNLNECIHSQISRSIFFKVMREYWIVIQNFLNN